MTLPHGDSAQVRPIHSIVLLIMGDRPVDQPRFQWTRSAAFTGDRLNRDLAAGKSRNLTPDEHLKLASRLWQFKFIAVCKPL